MKNVIIAFCGIVGGCFASFLGGLDSSIITLLIFMSIDYISGLIVAGVFHKSAKTKNGALESRAGFKGLLKKGVVLCLIGIANRLDIQLGITGIRDGVAIAFIANELISIIENAGLMGVPIPKILTNAIDLLKEKEGDENENSID